MGCVSSTQVITDPVTGEVKTKKRNGGAYPGQRGQQHAPYQPPASAFQNGKAVAHFVSYGGGNALTLMQPDGSTQPQRGSGKQQSQFVQVTLPEGVKPGQKIKVLSPDERLNEIIIPEGFGPGSTFTVEFAPESEAPTPPTFQQPPENDKIPVQQAAQVNNTRPTPAAGSSSAPYATATATTSTATATAVDDGFASGFNNPNWTPASDNDTNAYPTSQAVAVAPSSSMAGPYATAKPYGP